MKRARLTSHGIFTPRTRTRQTDPATSTTAAGTVDIPLVQRRVLALFNLDDLSDGIATHKIVIHHYRRIYGEQVAESTIRTRVAELVDLGFMEDTGCTVGADRPETVWGLTEKGRGQCRKMQQ